MRSLADPLLDFVGNTLIVFGGALLTLVVLVAWFLRKPILAVTAASPEAVIRDLAFRLRATGHWVKEREDRLDVRIDSLSALRIHVHGGPNGTEVRYEVSATPSGWTVVLVSAGVGYFGYASVLVSLLIHFRSRRFARDTVGQLLRLAPLGTPPPADVRTLLVVGLSEAERLATEAFEYEREAKQNRIGILLFGAVILWAVVFAGLPILLPGPLGLPLGTAAATASAVALAVAGASIVTVRSNPRIRELQQEAGLYAAARAFEASGFPAPGGPRGGLELLLRAAERSSYWREVRRRHMWHDPVTGFVVFLFAYGGSLTVALGAGMDFLPLPLRVGLLATGVTMLLGMWWSIRSWRRDVRKEDERDRADWEARRQALSAELWKILSG